jgi:hypothetical protein
MVVGTVLHELATHDNQPTEEPMSEMTQEQSAIAEFNVFQRCHSQVPSRSQTEAMALLSMSRINDIKNRDEREIDEAWLVEQGWVIEKRTSDLEPTDFIREGITCRIWKDKRFSGQTWIGNYFTTITKRCDLMQLFELVRTKH